ncbi:MAG: tripartite tricarboxylate transporter substrate binding protein [Burkholderiaceae bacterium]|nr:tripartite tricarboxylate transporter substrate binding protein [Rhodoferax sp.]MCB2008921.1 tripartite tricarboxylate transporter substrate binding protein [Rhodoferax sp.]MCB2036507.1 tripartite tricarboxylate transporter substrate binding protein [Ottowia sp.]
MHAPFHLISRRQLGLAALACVSAMATPHVLAQNWPDKPIRIVVPYAPGAAADQLARAVGARLSTSLGQPVIVENRAGAGGTVGADYVAKAAPDGYTIVLGSDASHASNVFLVKKFPYDPIKSFTPIAPAAINHIVLVVNPSLPVKSISELIAYAKAHPNKLSFGSSGPGSAHHLAGELLNEKAGIHMVHVPYKGGGPAMADLLANTVPVLFASMATAKPQLDAGKVRALALVDAKRMDTMPKLPTIGETVPGYAISSWLAFFGPAGLPAPIVTRLNTEINKALAAPEFHATLEAAGLSVEEGTPQDLAAQQRNSVAQAEKLIKAAGIEPQ